MDLQKLLHFVRFSQLFREVERKVLIKKSQRPEGDAEHSFQLALVAWYLIDSNKLHLNTDRVIKYALVHDLVETYAGDTPMNSKDKEYLESKAEREKAAEIKIQKEFPEFPELIQSLHDYEKRKDNESKFVYALDKLLPPLNIYLEDGYSWKMNDVSLDLIITSKKEKIIISLEIKNYFDQLVELLKKDENRLFNK